MATMSINRATFTFRCASGHERVIDGEFDAPVPKRPVCQTCRKRMRITGTVRMLIGELAIQGRSPLQAALGPLIAHEHERRVIGRRFNQGGEC